MKFGLAFALLIFITHSGLAVEDKEQPRLLVHLLEYIAADYPGAVVDGRVKSAPEYAEQKEFMGKAMESLAALPALKSETEISQGMDQLQKLISGKAKGEEVAQVANRVKSHVIRVAKIDVAPSSWPNRHHGKELFAQNCVSCHGNTGHGDGPSGTNLDPKPTNFHDGKMASVPPFQAFNTIRLGVPGTGMAEFASFSDREVWDLAFYVASLRFEGKAVSELDQKTYRPPFTLSEVSTKSDEELSHEISGSSVDKEKQLALIRQYVPSRDDSNRFLALAKSNLSEALNNFRSRNNVAASKYALLAYLDGIEPVEPRLRSKDAAFVGELEMKMLEVRSAVDRKADIAEVTDRVNQAEAALGRAESLLAKNDSSPVVTFSVAAGIFLREAFEAVLILITILGVLKSVGSRKAVLYVHGGWMAAVFSGIVCWFFSGWVMQISGANRELLEGVVSLLAVAVLMYFGFWLHRKTEIGKWRLFIKEMLDSVMNESSLWGLAGLSFMAVFREAFETVLFLRALLLEAEGQQTAVLGGVLLAFVLVLILASALLKYSAKIPVRQLFDISSVVMIVLAFILVGKAAHSFQETGMLPMTHLPFRITFDLVGFYPTYETFLAQVVVLTLSLSFWWLGKRSPTNQQQTA